MVGEGQRFQIDLSHAPALRALEDVDLPFARAAAGVLRRTPDHRYPAGFAERTSSNTAGHGRFLLGILSLVNFNAEEPLGVRQKTNRCPSDGTERNCRGRIAR